MKKKIIKIFIASSITELHDERNELDAFLNKIGRKLCDKYIDRDLYVDIVPIRCEDVDPAIAAGRKQDEYNELMRGCDMSVFLFFKKAGTYTIEEFDAALEAFKASGNVKPKIYTFFKYADISDMEQSVSDFMNRLDKGLNHYYTVFDSIDTVKLKLLLSLYILNSDFLEVKIDDGKCYVNGEAEIEVANVEQFANNGTLKDLDSELKEIEKEYYSLKAGYPFKDEKKNKQYNKLDERRQELIKAIEKLQKEIFNTSLSICKDELSGKEITVRLREAYRLFEKGDLKGANKILNYDEIKDEYLQRKKARQDEQKRDDEIYIRECKAKIRFLRSGKKGTSKFNEKIDMIYQDAVAVAKESLVEIDIIYDYASYLNDFDHRAEAYDVAKELEKIYNSAELQVDLCEKAELYNLFFCICTNTTRWYVFFDDLNFENWFNKKEAEKYLKKEIEVYNKLVNDNPDKYIYNLTDSYNTAAVFYKSQKKLIKAEKYHLKKIKIFEKLSKINPDRYNSDLAESYCDIGEYYKDYYKIKLWRAIYYYQKAITIYEKIVSTIPKDQLYNLRRMSYGSPFRKPIVALAWSYWKYGELSKNRGFIYKAYDLARECHYWIGIDSSDRKINQIIIWYNNRHY